MKIRTVYFKVSDMNRAIAFWEGLLGKTPPKRSAYWSEFKCSNINLGLLWEEGFQIQKNQSNFIPVFELQENEMQEVKNRAIKLGASLLIDIKDHPDKKSYVLCDPFGNEFEITKFRD